jgi:hypothetical protein
MIRHPQHILTTVQRLVLVDCMRLGLTGWLTTCPRAGTAARRLRRRSTTAAGFQFSRFASLAMAAFGCDYRPRCVGTGREFPLSILEAVVLANDLELDLATADQIQAAAVLASHCAYAQPETDSYVWRHYTAALSVLGLSMMGGDPGWRATVRERLREFRGLLVPPHAAE